MKVRCISTRLTDQQKELMQIRDNRDPHYRSTFILNKDYVVLGITYLIGESWNTPLYQLRNEIFNYCISVPACLFEIIDSRSSIFWQARQEFPSFKLWPTEFYQDFFHDDLSEGIPHVKRIFDSVVDRLTYEFEDATQGLPDPLAWPFEEYK